MRDLVRSLVAGIDPCDLEEAAHRRDALGWIDSGDELFRRAKPATPPKHLVSYCVLVDADARHVFLVEHRDAGQWLPTGGHVEPGEDPVVAAHREIAEELQISPQLHSAAGAEPLMVTVRRTIGASEGHTDVSLWYVFDGSMDSVLIPDETEFSATRWWPFHDVKDGSGISFDPHLPRFIDKLEARLI